MSYFAVYWVLTLDNINNLFVITTILLPVTFIAGFIIHAAILEAQIELSEEKKEKKLLKIQGKILKFIIPFFLLSILSDTFLPTTKQAATIYLLPKIANNKSLQQLPSQTANLLLLEVKKEISSLKDTTASEIVKKVVK